MLLVRGEWSFCAMEHSRIGAIELREAGAPFHHIALPLERHSAGAHVGARCDEPWRVRNALAFIHAHLTDDITLGLIAIAARTSLFYLTHVFRRAIGCSIWQYGLGARARYAAALMRDDEATLLSIAFSAGFSTYAGFIQACKAEFGKTPANLRTLMSQ